MTRTNGWALKPEDVQDVIEAIPSNLRLRPFASGLIEHPAATEGGEA